MKTLYYNGRVYTGALPLQEAFLYLLLNYSRVEKCLMVRTI